VAQEKQNFANWFQYYRSRLLSAQAGIPEAMQPFDDRLRVGWGRLKKTPTVVDGVSTAIVETGVRNFDTTQKPASSTGCAT
jgi:type IV pilus assembly protein PilY1